MKIWDAIKEMRYLTETGKSFSLSFMSFNSTAMTSEGVVEVEKAKLRKKADSNTYRNADILLPYVDCENGEARQFYIPCLMTFNGKKITIR